MSSQESETVGDLKQQLAERDALIRELAEALREAREEIGHWAQYSSAYLQEKHNLPRALASIDAVLAKVPESATN